MKRNILFISLVVAYSGSAFAGYAQAVPPVNWSEQVGKHFYKAAANDTFFSGGVRLTGGVALDVGGRTIKVPAVARFAANAPRYAALAIGMHPGVRLAVGVATWLGAAGIVYDIGRNVWQVQTTEQPCPMWYWHPSIGMGTHFCSGVDAIRGRAIQAAASNGWNESNVQNFTFDEFAMSGNWQWNVPALGPPFWAGADTQVTKSPNPNPPAQGQPRDIPIEEIPPLLEPIPMPQTVPLEIPEPLPMRVPILNPVPYPEPLPESEPQPSPIPETNSPASDPFDIPTGDPEPVPDSSPQTWRQPVTNVKPSPTVDEPWRVNLTPRESIKNTPDPLPEPKVDPNPAPKPEDKAADTPLPEQANLYTKKYPEGIKGVWDAKKAQLQSSPLNQLVNVLLPPMAETGGTCPVFVLPASLAVWADFGDLDVSPPCWIWGVLKALVIISALILARALVFGG